MQNYPSFTHLAPWLSVDAEAKPKSKQHWPSEKGPVRSSQGTAGAGREPRAAPMAWEEERGGGQHRITQDDSVQGGSFRKDTRPGASWPAVPTSRGTNPVYPEKRPVTSTVGTQQRCRHIPRQILQPSRHAHCTLDADVPMQGDPSPHLSALHPCGIAPCTQFKHSREDTSRVFTSPPLQGILKPYRASLLPTAIRKGLPRPSRWRRACAGPQHIQQAFLMEQKPLQRL